MAASFRLSLEQLEKIRRALETEERIEPVFLVEVKDEAENVIAEVQKTLHIRKKKRI